MKTEYLMSMENSDGLLEEIGTQALTTASYQLPDSVLQTIDAVALSDVVQVCAVLIINEPPNVTTMSLSCWFILSLDIFYFCIYLFFFNSN